jgi:hypothetical protein
MTSYKKQYLMSFYLQIILLTVLATSCNPPGEGKNARRLVNDEPEKIVSNISGTGQELTITALKGKYHNHPTYAIWLEDTSGKYFQTLFVTQAIGQGIFNYGDKSEGKWKAGEVRRPAALPYWSHKRGIKAEDGLYVPSKKSPVPDAYTGATPKGSFILQTRPDAKGPRFVKVLMEVNQPWDWNEYWTNALHPEDENYMTSCQPAVVYSAIIDLESAPAETLLVPVGHSQYSGRDGSLDPNLSTHTSALQIFNAIKVEAVKK